MAKIATFYDHIVDISRQENMFVVDALKLARELEKILTCKEFVSP